jgi:hypothetical protein
MQPSCFVVRPRPSFGATRARLLAENLGGLAPKDVVAPRSDGVPRTAKYQARSRAGTTDVLVLISEVWAPASRRRRCASWAS